jgi:hypothetical protein
MGIWAALARLRDISRLVLAAIERNDLEGIQRLAHEGDALAKIVQPCLPPPGSDTPLPARLEADLADLADAYRAIARGLEARRAETLTEVRAVRRTRLRLAATHRAAETRPTVLDRST